MFLITGMSYEYIKGLGPHGPDVPRPSNHWSLVHFIKPEHSHI